MKNNKSGAVYYSYSVCAVIISILCLVYRAMHGIDFTDETWYVAEPYIVSNGAIPFVNNWTQAPGFVIPVFLAFKLYVLLTGGTEGIFLFSRSLYIIWIFACMTLSVWLINKKLGKALVEFPVLIIFPLMNIHILSMFDINYNSIGVVYTLLGGVILLLFPEKKIYSFIAGMIMARAIIGTPFTLIIWISFFAYLIIKKEYKSLIGFLLGGMVMAMMVVGTVCALGGVRGFINGMYALVKDSGYFKISPIHDIRKDFISLLIFSLPAIAALALTLYIKYVKKSSNRVIKIICAASFLFGIFIALTRGINGYCVSFIWYIPIVLSAMKHEDEKYKKVFDILAFLCVMYYVAFAFSSLSNIYGFGGREYWLEVPCALSVWLYSISLEDDLLSKLIITVGLTLLGIVYLKANYGFTYRDACDFNELNKRIESGIWKGLYTTEKRAENVVELERYLKSVTNTKDEVLFMDQAGFGYLMANGKSCTSTTLDNMGYDYKINNSEVLYDYFSLTGRVPSKIIYICFTENISIDDPDWEFNNFVNNYYALQDVYFTTSEEEVKISRTLPDTDKFAFEVRSYELTDAYGASSYAKAHNNLLLQ